jgi:hypothetical protein
MSRWRVTMPVAGSIIVEVEADSEEAAYEAAYEQADVQLDCQGDTEPGELEVLKNITRGNVCYAPVWHASAEPIEEDEESA